MRVLFIYTDIGISVGYSCGIGVLSAYLKENGHSTRLIHLSDELGYPLDLERIASDVREYDPGLIAFSAVTNQWYFVKQIAKFLRRHFDTPIIVGGHHANAAPEEIVRENAVDYACKGEGERPLLELVNRLEAGMLTENIPNITMKRRKVSGRNSSFDRPRANGNEEVVTVPELVAAPAVDIKRSSTVTLSDSKARVNATHSQTDTEVIDNKMERWVQDLDQLPFEDRELFSYDKIVRLRHGWAEVIASRGCPYACTYCFNLPFVARYKNDTKDTADRLTLKDFVRRRSVESTVAMLKEIKDNYPAVKYFTFVDDVFAIYSRWLADLAPVYAREIGLPFACTTQPLAFNVEIARLLKEMGCKVVKMGVESGNVRLRNQVLNRNIPDDVLIKDFRIAREYGLMPQAFNMIGLPGETAENMLETVRLNAKIRSYIVGVSTFMPYPGTVLHDFCVNNDLIDPQKWNEVRSFRGGSVLKETSFKYIELEKVRILFKWHLNAALDNPCSAEYQRNIDDLDTISDEEWFNGKVEQLYNERDPTLDQRFRELEVDHYITRNPNFMFWSKDYGYDIS